MRNFWVPALRLMTLSGCAAHPPGKSPEQATEVRILARSTPADGSTVAGPVDNLQLVYVRPARLLEVTVEGPDGLSPTMVNAVGEVTDYSIPLPGLTSGNYRVNWRASAAGRSYNGVLKFTVGD